MGGPHHNVVLPGLQLDQQPEVRSSERGWRGWETSRISIVLARIPLPESEYGGRAFFEVHRTRLASVGETTSIFEVGDVVADQSQGFGRE